jgi:hypothetical protein
MNVALTSAAVEAQLRTPPWLPPPNLQGQDFASGSIPSGWSTDSGSPIYNYQPSIDGRYSLALLGTSDYVFATIPAQAELYIYMEIMFTAVHSSDQTFLILYNDALTVALKVQMLAGTKNFLVLDTGGAHTAITTNGINPMKPYSLWVHYLAGTGANATLSVGFSDGGPEPVAGNNFASIAASGASTVSPTKMYLQKESGTNVIVFDRVGLSTIAMPNGW